jgi:arabinogalactan endo-1,4-beta-galactosidase
VEPKLVWLGLVWYDEQGSKKQYLKTLEEEGINLSNIFLF